MNFYQIYGGRLESEIEIPELRIAEPGPADWRLRLAASVDVLADATPIGVEQLLPDVCARLSRASDRFRLTLLSTGNETDRADAYRAFRGRDPDVDALLKRRGFPVK